MSSYLVTGAGRGVGLELAAQLSRKPSSEVSVVFATTRSSQPPATLKTLIDASQGRVVHIPITLTEKSSIASGASLVEQKLGTARGLDVLINNAGVMPAAPGGIHTMDNLSEGLKVNVEAVHDMTVAFLPLLRKGVQKKVMNVSTSVGSITYADRYTWGSFPSYKISKAALNMMTVQYAFDFGKEGFAFFCVSPGWLKTDMGSQAADLEVEVGVKAVLDILPRDNAALNGKHLNIHVPGWEKAEGPNQYDGGVIPW